MGLFSFTQEIAMDLGTANTIIIMNGKIVVDQPSVVALDRNDKVIAIGKEAQQMHGRVHDKLRTVRPLRDGVIADFYAAEQMIRGMIKMINTRRSLFSPSMRMVVCIPSGSTEVEVRAVRERQGYVDRNGRRFESGYEYGADPCTSRGFAFCEQTCEKYEIQRDCLR